MSKIIVVDDDPTNVGLLKMLLEMDGFEVTACADIPAAETAAEEQVLAFVIDINLARGASGIDLLRAIRAGQLNVPNSTPVIMSSGDHRREDESLAAGANLFLLKPYSPSDLSDELRKVQTAGGSNE